MTSNLYHYSAIVTDVYNGNTCMLDIDLGFSTWLRKERVQLNRIHAPELTGAEKKKGIASREYLKKLLLKKTVTLETICNQNSKGGRYVVEMWIVGKSGIRLNVNDLMVEKGYAVYRHYR
ncbi:MAG: thermonuclease family protein [Ignavibacteriales bacterium]|nr:thermonuclease family protein [Ignavibacteriales bacterium]